MNGKKITSSVLAAIMLAGTTNVFAAMPDKSVVIGEKAFAFGYANADENKKEILDAMKNKGEGAIYVKANNKWFNNDKSTLSDTSVIPAVVYTNAEGETADYEAADGEVSDGVSDEFEVVDVSAISNTKIEVELEEAVDAVSTAGFQIVKKGTDEALEVKEAIVDGDIVVLEVEEMQAGEAYTLTANEVSKNFTAIKENKAAAKLSKVELTDDNVVTVTFDKMVDEVSAETIENYSIDKSIVVLEASLNSDRKSVDLKTEGIVKSKRYKLTVQDVDSIDGVEMKSKGIKTFVSKSFEKAPTLKAVKNGHYDQTSSSCRYNNTTLTVEFTTNGHKLDKEAAENVDNYSIEGLDIEEATYVYDSDNDKHYVTLKTEVQKAGKSYKLKVENISDVSALKNVMSKEAEKSFKGGYEDKKAPSIAHGKYQVAESNTRVKVTFTEKNALDPSSALDVSNYEFDKDLEVEAVEFDDADAPYTEEGRTVIITTSEQDSKKTYKLKISNVQDEYGNAMDDGGKSYLRVRGVEAKHNAPYITDIKATKQTEIKITFDRSVDKTTATDATNYQVFDGSDLVSTAVKAKVSGAVVTLTVPSLTANETYKVKVSNVEDLEENAIETISKSVTAPGAKNDVEKPEVADYVVVANDQIIVEFTEAVKKADKNKDIELTIGDYEFTGVEFMDNDTRLIMIAKDGKEFKTTDVLDVDSLTNVMDMNRNALETKDMPSVPAMTEDSEAPVVTGWEQVDVKTMKVSFDQPVKIPAKDDRDIGQYTLSYDGDEDSYDEKSVVLFTKDSGIFDADDDSVELSLSSIEGFSGKDALNEDGDKKPVEVDPYMEDTDAPVIEDAVAINNKEVEVTFDEEISFKGSYKLQYLNDKDVKSYISTTAELDGSKVILTTSKELKGDVDYTLLITTTPKDLANNRLDKDEYEEVIFMGSDVKEVEVVSGVKHVNANVVELVGKMVTEPLMLGTLTVTTEASIADKTITADVPFLASQTYELGDDVSFKGSVENNSGLTLTEDTAKETVEVYFDEMDEDDKYALVYFNVEEKATLSTEKAEVTTLTSNKFDITEVKANNKVLVFLYDYVEGYDEEDYLLNANPLSGEMN